MLVKRPIYNDKLKCVAFEILASGHIEVTDAIKQNLVDIIAKSETHLPLFIPFAFKPILEQLDPPVENPIILKLAAEDIDSLYSAQELQESLYSIALLISAPQQLAWLNFAEYIALSEKLMGSDLSKVVKYSKDKQRKVIACDLAQPQNFDKCKTMTMDYYCGDFLFKPVDTEQTEIAASKINVLQLIQTIQKEDCELADLSKIIQNDPLLSYQLIKMVNSAAFSTGYTISSIEQAVARLGLIKLKNWIMLFSMKNISDKPVEILESGLIRAHMAQELAKVSPNISPQTAYTTGLLSILDCLLNKSMPDIMQQLTLSDEITNALLTQQGPLGELLTIVIAYEAGNWENVPQPVFNGLDLSKLYVDSLGLVTQGAKVLSK